MSDIEWTPDERTVQACIDALPTSCGCSCNRADRAALEALLPKPDPDVEVVRKVLEVFAGQCPADCDVDFQDALAAYKANKP